MTWLRKAHAALLFLGLLCGGSAHSCDVVGKATPAYAAKQARGYDDVLWELQRDACLGAIESDSANPLVKRINEITPDKVLDQAMERVAAGRVALLELAGFSERRARVGVQAETWLSMANQLKSVVSGIDAITVKTPGLLKIDSNRWSRLDGHTEGEVDLDGRQYRLLKATGCAATDSACPAFESQADLVRVFRLAFKVAKYLSADGLAVHYEDALIQTERWEVYREKAQHQYWWELLLNKASMGRDHCARSSDTGIERGFCSTPSSQIIFLHPEAALRWSRYANASSELKPALVVELIGAYRWDWEGEKSAGMKNRFGASLVASYADESVGRKWSYGPMFHFGDGYNLAITRVPGENWSLMFSINLAERFFGRKKEAVDFLKKLP